MNNFLRFGIISLLIIFSFGCNKNDEINNEGSIIGNWKLTDAYISSGGPQYWVTVEKGEEFTFFGDGTFSSNKFSECTSGTFSIELNKLILNYDCVGFTTEIENLEGAITYEITFESNYFFLTPTSVICIEGCSYKYQKK